MKIVVNMPKKPYNLDELMLALEKAKPLPVVTNKVLDKISAEIKEVTMKRPMTMDYECGLNEARSIIEKYKGVSK